MAPQKNLPPAKMALVLSYFRTTAVAHTLKDLEKTLPPAAGISGMLVKDYLAALVADSVLVVEKIGSGNWYWSFPADAKRQKEHVVSEVTKERDKARIQLESAEQAVNEEKMRLEGGDDGEGKGRVELVERLSRCEKRRTELKTEIERFQGAKGADVVMDEKEKLKFRVNELVDNLYTLEGHFKELVNGDPEVMAGIRQMFDLEEEIEYIEA